MKKTKTARIQDLLAQGKSQADIAKSLKVSRQLVYGVARKTKENNAAESLYERYNKGNTVRPKLRMMSAIEETNKDIGKLFSEAYEKYKDDDTVNHPPHYRAGGIETIDFIEAKDLNYRLGNVVKYVSRAGKKASDPIEDLKKAAWYLEREITARERA